MSEKSTPDYGRLRTFWQAKTDSNEVAPQGDSVSVDGVRKSASKLATLAAKYSSPTTTPPPSNRATPPQNNSILQNSTEKSKTTNIDSSDMADVAPSLLEFDQDIVGGNLAEFLQHAQKLGGEVAEHAVLIRKAFGAQRNFLAIATRYAKPNDAELQKLLTDTANAINEIQQFREKRRASPVFNHLSAVSESIPALAWVTIAPTPAPYVKEMNDAGQFYSNRVLKDFKDKPGHAEWARSLVALWTNLQTYVRKNHTTGLVWGKQPYVGSGAAPAGGPPPPPPPPAFELDLSNLEVSDDRAALFQELNRGTDVTKGLKKVTADMQTHKNPNLRAGGTVPVGVGSANHASREAPKTPSVKPPKLTLEGKKWIVEHQIGQKELKIENVEMNQVVYMFGCKDSTIQIKGKLNSIVVDSCIKTAVVFDSLVASVEFVNCRDCQTQVMGTVPTITIDKTDGLQMFLNKDSLQVEIVSAKSSALNVMVPQASGDYAEWPVPEQFKTTIGPKGLITTSTELVGA